LTIVSTPDVLRFEVDGEELYSQAGGTAFDQIYFGMSAPSWRPAVDTWFDDFSYQQVPEPSAIVMWFGLAVCAAVGIARRRKRRV